MKRIDRYLLREFLIPLAYCVSGFSMIYVVYDLFDHLAKFGEAHTPPALVARYYLCMLAPALTYLMPASLLLATLYTLWHLSRNNELVAMRASGISFARLMAPFLGVGLAFSLAVGLIQELWASPAGQWAADFSESNFKEFKHKIYKNRAHYNSGAHRQWLIGRLDIHDPNRLIRVKVTQERPDGSRLREIVADKAEWLDGEWWFFDMHVQEYDLNDNPIGDPVRTSGSSKAPVVVPSFKEQPADFVNEIRSWDSLSGWAMYRFLSSHPSLSDQASARMFFDLHSRAAMPWACLVVTLFAIPAGARHGRQGALAGVFLAVAFFFAFYVLNQVGLFLGKRDILWPWLGAWLSNIVFLAIGTIMVFRIK